MPTILLAVFVGLPQNPCATLTAEEVARATGVAVTRAARVPSISEIVEAQDAKRPPPPGSICSYATGTPYGAIMISTVVPGSRTADLFRERRIEYNRGSRSPLRRMPGLGVEAWSHRNSVIVYLDRGQVFTVGTQMDEPGAEALVIAVAHAFLKKVS
jgi:hypothetical protein